MPDAECFMFLVAQLQRLFRDGGILVAEGGAIAPDVAALYLANPAPAALSVPGRPRGTRYRVALGPRLTRPLNDLASRRTYAELGERLFVYSPEGALLFDGGRLDERVARVSAAVPEAEVRRFAGGRLRGLVEWVAE